MLNVFVIILVITLFYSFRDRNQYEIVFSGSEANLNEANNYYWLLKNNQIPLKYQIPYNWENFYRFGYKECPVYIKVRKGDIERARKVMMYYRSEKMKIESNMKVNKRGFGE